LDSTSSKDDLSQDRGWRFGLAARPMMIVSQPKRLFASMPLLQTHGLAGDRALNPVDGWKRGWPTTTRAERSVPGVRDQASRQQPLPSRPKHSVAMAQHEHPSTRNVGMAAQPHKSCRPRSTSRLGRAPTFPTAFLHAAPKPGPAGRRAAHLRSEAGRAPAAR
jgi:hypothetical protein